VAPAGSRLAGGALCVSGRHGFCQDALVARFPPSDSFISTASGRREAPTTFPVPLLFQSVLPPTGIGILTSRACLRQSLPQRKRSSS
jgi:hypothetical protein